jgi:hypothetical protein
MEITHRMMEKMLSKHCLFAFEGAVSLPISRAAFIGVLP